MSARLAGKIAVVVHVGSALARGCALRFMEEGADVVLIDPILATAEDLATEISGRGGGSMALQADVGNSGDIQRAVTSCAARWGRVDVLYITIGVVDWWTEEEETMELWQENIQANLLTPIFYTKLFRPLLAASGSGSVIFYGSIDGIHGNPRFPAYSVSRGGLIPFTHIMGDELGPDNIRVNYIAGAAIMPSGPGNQDRSRFSQDHHELLRATPLGRRATAEDVAGVASFLASADSAYVNGAVIVMDAGRTAITPGTSRRT